MRSAGFPAARPRWRQQHASQANRCFARHALQERSAVALAALASAVHADLRAWSSSNRPNSAAMSNRRIYRYGMLQNYRRHETSSR
jgi:hypothetical protein